jgi:predicted PurR-regulated permease PerM
MDDREQKPFAVEMPIDVRNLALTLLAFAAGVMLLRYAEEVLVPIVLSILISYALWPVVNWLVRLKVPRTIAAGLVLLAATWGVGWTLYTVRFQAYNLIDQIPDATRLVQREILRGRTGDSAMSKLARIP